MSLFLQKHQYASVKNKAVAIGRTSLFLKKDQCHRVVMILAMLAIIWLVSACQTSQEVKPEVENFVGGVDVLIDGNSIPPRIIQNQLFPLRFKVKNTGVSPSSGVVVVRGAPSFIEFKNAGDNPSLKVFKFSNLQGRSTLSPNPGELSYQVLVHPLLDKLTESKTANLEVSLCYTYSLFFKDNVCIDTRPDLPSEEKACTFTPKSYRGQGAPIDVVFLEERSYLDEENKRRVDFVITLQNMMKGSPLPFDSALPDENNYCLGGSKDVRLGYLNIEVQDIRLGGIKAKDKKDKGVKFECHGLNGNDKQIPFVNFQSKIICTAIFDSDVQPYSTLLELSLKFGYYSDLVIPLKIYKN